MKNNFFELVNNNFFSIFTGKYKEINYAILTRINEECSNVSGQLDKDQIIDIISTYFRENPNIARDENNEIIEYKKDPYLLVKDYERSGWLISETTSDFRIMYQMDPVALQVLSAMENAVKEDSKPLESSGFVHLIYKSSKNFDITHGTAEVEQLLKLKQDLDTNLRMVNSKIKKYLNNLLKDENQHPEKILKELLLNYQENVVAKSFNNLRTKDNPSKYKDEIIGNLNHLINNNLDELVNNYIDTKLNGKHTEENILIAKRFFISAFEELITLFKVINSKIDVLDNQNTKYVSSARARLSFLLNDKNNLEGKIDRLLKQIEDLNLEENQEFEIEDFDLFELGHIDDSSLYYYQKSNKTEESVAEEIHSEVSEETKLRYKEQILRLNKFTIKGVDSYIEQLLKDKDEVIISDIEIHDMDEFMSLFLARIYASSKAVHYKIHVLPTLCRYKNNEIQNYKLTRRK